MVDATTQELPSEVQALIMDRSGQMCEACEEEFGTRLYSPSRPLIEAPPEDIVLLCSWCYGREAIAQHQTLWDCVRERTQASSCEDFDK
ncbi:hypothetical protein N9B71_05910 [Pirellulales bacterium]|jgi:hypothetical protein|nr:hypothetical protein [Pirellulales bacterium]